MKKAEEWCSQYRTNDEMVLVDLVLAIQADALRHAAEVCHALPMAADVLLKNEAQRLEAKP